MKNEANVVAAFIQDLKEIGVGISDEALLQKKLVSSKDVEATLVRLARGGSVAGVEFSASEDMQAAPLYALFKKYDLDGFCHKDFVAALVI